MQAVARKRIDTLGRIVLPMELRRNHDLVKWIDIFINENGQIVLQKAEPCCKICGTTDSLTELSERMVWLCDTCIKIVKSGENLIASDKK